MENLTSSQLVAAATNYDNTVNEGGEGYNPYRAEIERRATEAEANRPKTSADRKAAVLHELSVKDCAIARESGTYDQTEIDALRAELRQIESDDDAAFRAEWTRDVFEARRVAWNERVLAHGDKLTQPQLYAIINELGYGIDQLRRAKAIYG